MFDRKAIKLQGKANTKKNYWGSVVCALIYSYTAVTASGSSAAGGSGDSLGQVPPWYAVYLITILIVSIVLRIFVFNPLEIGCCGFFEENVNGKPDVKIVKEGFKNYGHTFVVLFMRDLIIFLLALLFFIPGIVKSYSYRMVPFILRDNPDLSYKEVLARSKTMMNGHKWDVFVFDLSYIGWAILGGFTFGLLNVFWTEPYRRNANAGIYLQLRGE